MTHLQEQPQILKTGERGVGRRVDDLRFKNRGGGDVKLAAAKSDRATVIALFSATCPISNKLGPELARIEKDYAGKNVGFFLVNITPETKAEEVRKYVADFGLKSP